MRNAPIDVAPDLTRSVRTHSVAAALRHATPRVVLVDLDDAEDCSECDGERTVLVGWGPNDRTEPCPKCTEADDRVTVPGPFAGYPVYR